MYELDTRGLREILAGDVGRGSDACRSECQLARLRFRRVDQRLERPVRAVRRSDHDVGRRAEHGDVDQVFRGIVREVLVDRRIHCVRGRLHDQRVAVGRSTHDDLRADLSACTRPVVDQHGLLPHVLELAPDDAARDVGSRSGGERHHDAHRPRRKLLSSRIQRRHERHNGQRAYHVLPVSHGNPLVAVKESGRYALRVNRRRPRLRSRACRRR